MEPKLAGLSLTAVAQRCARESQQFFHHQPHDPRFCFELFRRACQGGLQQAWDYIHDQYRPLVVSWVKQHSAFPESGEEVDYFVNRALEKLWSALTPHRFSHFSDLSAILRYLQTCVHSVILDHVRLAEHSRFQASVDDPDLSRLAADENVEDDITSTLQQAGLWSLLQERLNSLKEERYCYGSFVLGLKPREILDHFPDQFEDANDVYRTREYLLARLQRDEQFLSLLAEYA